MSDTPETKLRNALRKVRYARAPAHTQRLVLVLLDLMASERTLTPADVRRATGTTRRQVTRARLEMAGGDLDLISEAAAIKRAAAQPRSSPGRPRIETDALYALKFNERFRRIGGRDMLTYTKDSIVELRNHCCEITRSPSVDAVRGHLLRAGFRTFRRRPSLDTKPELWAVGWAVERAAIERTTPTIAQLDESLDGGEKWRTCSGHGMDEPRLRQWASATLRADVASADTHIVIAETPMCPTPAEADEHRQLGWQRDLDIVEMPPIIHRWNRGRQESRFAETTISDRRVRLTMFNPP